MTKLVIKKGPGLRKGMKLMGRHKTITQRVTEVVTDLKRFTKPSGDTYLKQLINELKKVQADRRAPRWTPEQIAQAKLELERLKQRQEKLNKLLSAAK